MRHGRRARKGFEWSRMFRIGRVIRRERYIRSHLCRAIHAQSIHQGNYQLWNVNRAPCKFICRPCWYTGVVCVIFIRTKETTSKASNADSDANDAVTGKLLKSSPITLVCQVAIHLRRRSQCLLAGNVSGASLRVTSNPPVKSRTSYVSEMKKHRPIAGYHAAVDPTSFSTVHLLAACG